MATFSMTAQYGQTRDNASDGQGTFSQSKWNLLKAAEEAREPLGLQRTSLALLRAMISFIRTDSISSSAADQHICFASNSALANRVHVSVKTVERHISILTKAGFLRRIVTGNGKRWARRDADGKIVIAAGLSLLPLSEKYEEIVQAAEAHKVKQQELSLLKDRCLLMAQQLRIRVEENTLLAKARNVLRRKQDFTALNSLLNELTKELSACGYIEPNTPKTRDTDAQNEGHKETQLNHKVKEIKTNPINVTNTEIEQSFPKLCAELRFARNNQHCDQILNDISRYLGLSINWDLFKAKFGNTLAFILLGYVYQRADEIRNHDAYMKVLYTRIQANEIHPQNLIKMKYQDNKQ